MDPYNTKILNYKRSLTAQLYNQGDKLVDSKQISDEIKKYNSALELSPFDASLFYKRSTIYLKEGSIDLALKDAEEAAELEPNDINNYLLIDYILVRNSEWQKIINYWDIFIKLNPKNSRALLERSGTYYHQGNYKLALKDAKTSADLGNKKAMTYYRKLQNLVKNKKEN